MKLSSIFFMGIAMMGGIYLTSDEGAKTRKKILEKKNVLATIINDLKKQMILVLEGSKNIDSDEIKMNVEKLINESKKIIKKLDIDLTVETTKDIIKVASKKIRIAMQKTEKEINNKNKRIVKK